MPMVSDDTLIVTVVIAVVLVAIIRAIARVWKFKGIAQVRVSEQWLAEQSSRDHYDV